MRIFFPAFIPEPQGNKLASYEMKRVQESDTRRLYLCGPDEVAEQVLWMLQAQGARRIGLADGQERDWSHRIQLDGPLPEAVQTSLELLKRVRTLPKKPHLDVAIALDLYKTPDPELEPNRWPNTPAGAMVNAAKYSGNSDAFQDLVAELVRVVREHKIYCAVDLVSSVPGHNTTKTSFGESLARRVAARLATPLISPRAARSVRPAAKERESLETPLILEDEFAFDSQVTGRVVVIIDDVYRTGQTMDSIAKAAKEAGAVAALGLVGAKTLRNK